MMFDMGQAWNDGIARVRANFSLLAILGGVFFFLPSVVMYLAMPELMSVTMTPGADGEATARMLEGVSTTFIPLVFFVLIASLIGYCAMIALIGDSRRLSVGEAIATGFRALLPLLGVFVLFLIAYMLFAVAAGLLLGLMVGGLAMVSQGLAYGVAILLGAGVFIAVMLALTRLSMTLPVVAIERTIYPVAALRRSWAMTKPVQWRLLGFYALFFLAYIVIALVLFMIMGLIAALIGSPAASGFLNGLIGAVVAVIFSGLLAGIYRQLAGSSAHTVSETFE